MRMTKTLRAIAVVAAMTLFAAGPQGLLAQERRGSDPEHTLSLTWDRWLDHDEIGERMQLMAATWPDFLTLQSLGESYGGREMWMMTINNPATGDEMEDRKSVV